MSLLIFHASHIYWLFAPLCLWLVWRGGRYVRILALLALLPTSLLAYARFIEPRILQVHEETIILPGATATSPSIRIALFGDPHIGRFKNAMPIRRIVNKINTRSVDATFIAGDLTYHPVPNDIPTDFAPLAELTSPLYVVFGNHDVGVPGPDLTNPLLQSMTAVGGVIPHNRALDVEIAGRRIIVAGASDLWQRQYKFDFSTSLPEGVPVLLLTHNPDTALVVPDTFQYDLMLAGHTHGGQMRIPFLYKSVLPVDGPFDRELHHFETPNGPRLVYVTTGTGMVGLPMRLNMPPRIDILTIHLPNRKRPGDQARAF